MPLLLPAPPKFASEEDWHQVSLDQLRAWDWAAENPALLVHNGITIALTTHGLGDRSEFRKNLRRAIDRGLSESDALAALTTIPARYCNMGDQLGTLAPGKLANLTVVEGSGYFDPEARVREVWIDGRPYPSRTEAPPAPKEGEKKEGGESEEEETADAEKEEPEEKEDGEIEDGEIDEGEVQQKPTQPEFCTMEDTMAMLDMIISVVGDFYGQRDLLEERSTMGP